MTDDDEVGIKFCKVISKISGNGNPEPCMKAWARAKENKISQEDLNEYLDATYGKGNAHLTKEVILTIIKKENEE